MDVCAEFHKDGGWSDCVIGTGTLSIPDLKNPRQIFHEQDYKNHATNTAYCIQYTDGKIWYNAVKSRAGKCWQSLDPPFQEIQKTLIPSFPERLYSQSHLQISMKVKTLK